MRGGRSDEAQHERAEFERLNAYCRDNKNPGDRLPPVIGPRKSHPLVTYDLRLFVPFLQNHEIWPENRLCKSVVAMVSRFLWNCQTGEKKYIIDFSS
jgi:hypothetical protein